MEQCRQEARKTTELLSEELAKTLKFHGKEYWK
jgi:hypothetical protein